MRLTPAEKALIISGRDQKAKEKAHDKKTILLLKVAFQYQSWLQKNLRGSTFSTFVNEFGYSSDQTKNDYEVVRAIINTADERKRKENCI